MTEALGAVALGLFLIMAFVAYVVVAIWNWQWAWRCRECNRVKGYVPFGDLWFVETNLCSTCGNCASDVAVLCKVRWRFAWQVLKEEQP